MTDRAPFRVELTHGAKRDLADIVDFISENASADVAADVLGRILEKTASLERFPERGVHPKELAELGIRDFRQLNVGVYRLIARVVGKVAYVVLVADGRRDMTSLLQWRLLSS